MVHHAFNSHHAKIRWYSMLYIRTVSKGFSTTIPLFAPVLISSRREKLKVPRGFAKKILDSGFWMESTRSLSGICYEKLDRSNLAELFLKVDIMAGITGIKHFTPNFQLKTSKKFSWKWAKMQFYVVILAYLISK